MWEIILLYYIDALKHEREKKCFWSEDFRLSETRTTYLFLS
jgi:hypothetical protein